MSTCESLRVWLDSSHELAASVSRDTLIGFKSLSTARWAMRCWVSARLRFGQRRRDLNIRDNLSERHHSCETTPFEHLSLSSRLCHQRCLRSPELLNVEHARSLHDRAVDADVSANYSRRWHWCDLSSTIATVSLWWMIFADWWTMSNDLIDNEDVWSSLNDEQWTINNVPDIRLMFDNVSVNDELLRMFESLIVVAESFSKNKYCLCQEVWRFTNYPASYSATFVATAL